MDKDSDVGKKRGTFQTKNAQEALKIRKKKIAEEHQKKNEMERKSPRD